MYESQLLRHSVMSIAVLRGDAGDPVKKVRPQRQRWPPRSWGCRVQEIARTQHRVSEDCHESERRPAPAAAAIT
jgi:hypothetical protein